MDNSLADLVRDWELDTKFVSDKQTIHTTYVSDPARGRWRRAEEEVWDQTSLLGRGSFGVVSLQKCTSGPNSGNVRAVKEIQVTLDRSLDKFLSREISAIVKFSHMRFRACFVPSFGWYRDQNSIFITMEYLPLGDLQSYLNNPLPDSEARTITEQTLQGIDFMHRSKIAHRDLKPKNILVQHKGPNWWVKISDFGCSKQSESTSLRTIIGTEPYLAPELQNVFAPSDKEDLENEDDPDSPEAPGYSLAVDLWALGAITFRIATGRVPFPSPVGRKLSRYVAHGGPFPPDELLSSECREFIVSVMGRSPRERPSAAKALADPWIVCRPETMGPVAGPEIGANVENDQGTRIESPQTAFKEASGTWSTIQQSLPPQQKPLPEESHPIESIQLTRPISSVAKKTYGPRPTIRQDDPLQLKSAPGGSEARKPTRSQAPDARNGSGSTSIPPPEIVALKPIKIRSLDLKKSSLARTPSKVTSAPKTQRCENYWKDKGFRGPPSECIFSADGRWLVSVGAYGHDGADSFCIWEHNNHGRFKLRDEHLSTSHSGRVKMALSPTAKRLVVVENTGQTNMHQEYCLTWEFGPGGVIRPVNGFGDSHQRYADSWAISADTGHMFATTNTGDNGRPWQVIVLKLNSHDQFERIWSKKFKSKVEDIACSPNGDQVVAFHGKSGTIFQSDGSRGFHIRLWLPTEPGALGAGVRKWISAFSPDGRWFIVSNDRNFALLRFSRSRGWRRKQNGAFKTRAAVFSQDSKRFALGSLNGRISIWRLGKDDVFWEQKVLRLPIEGQLLSLVFSPCGEFLATTTENEFDVWEMF